MATETKAKAAKPAKAAPKGNEQAEAATPAPNRYFRAARIIVETGEGVDLAELAVKAGLTEAAAKYCLDAFKGVTQALREAKLLPARTAPTKAPAAPKEPVPA
jgi:hypothetical protein